METIHLISKRKIGRSLHHLVFSKNEDLNITYKIPGQYINLENEYGEQSFFAIASAPSDNTIDVLVKEQPKGVAYTLSYAEAGLEIVCSSAKGNGFPLVEAKDKNIHLFSMGSGIGPFRALIRHFLETKFSYRSLTLWQGSRSVSDLPFFNEYDYWRENKIQIRQCLSRESDKKNICQLIDSDNLKFKNEIGFWIGSSKFKEDLTSVLDSKGFDINQLYSNY